MLHIVTLLQRRFPQQHRAIIATRVLFSTGLLGLGIAELIRG